MTSYRINEIYDTIQGEGSQTGRAITLIRFAKCNLSCSYCDTEFDTFEEMSLEQIEAKCSRPSLLLTGGEPILQLDDEFIQYFKDRHYWLGIETSGSLDAKFSIRPDYITVSPKVKSLRFVRHRINEIRIPVIDGMRIDAWMRIDADHYYVSPVFDDDEKLNKGNLQWAMELLEVWPERLKLSVQTHKLIGME